jgi:deoxyadenosine/deoxycytidine kinase
MQQGKMPVILSIEGNIGAGKTTLLRAIHARYPDIKIIDEPVDTWEKLTTNDGKNIIQHFYSDMDRWAYTFQNAAILTRILNIQKAVQENPTAKFFITERSYLTDKYVFAKMLHKDEKMNELEMKLYNLWYDNFTKDIPINTILWLSTDSETCMKHIHKRGRAGEEKIAMSYLEQLDRTHVEWLHEPIKGTNIIKVPVGLTTDEICEKYIDEIYEAAK